MVSEVNDLIPFHLRYTIKPIKDSVGFTSNSKSSKTLSSPGPDTVVGGGSSSASSRKPWGNAEDQRQIFSYEIRLVLEYCNLGCLRNALDAGIFKTDQASVKRDTYSVIC